MALMRKVFVTGSRGFIGKRLVLALENSGYEVFPLDLLGGGVHQQKIDIVTHDLKELLNLFKPDAVIHLAAQVDVTASFENPIRDLEVNGLGTLRLVTSALEAGCTNFIYVASGGAIYDSNSEMPLSETSRELPVSPYGLTKSIGEGYTRVLSEKAGAHWTSLALSNCYGPLVDHKRGVIYEFWKSLSEGRPPHIFGPNVTRDFIFVDDVVRAVLAVIERPTDSRINISSGSEISLINLYNKVSKIMNSRLEPIAHEPKVGDVLRSCLSNSLAKEITEWEPRISLDEGLLLSIPVSH